ncbi:MAG: hypothetical protein QME96_10335, partial [Myxococcota bacterium]|nr:hypothetical protein [Myxococcota bacterium]
RTLFNLDDSIYLYDLTSTCSDRPAKSHRNVDTTAEVGLARTRPRWRFSFRCGDTWLLRAGSNLAASAGQVGP